jgi:NADPH2:quinone reductase
MEAIQVGRYGSRAVLRRVELPDPEPALGEILVRQEAAGVNFIDVYPRSGSYPLPLPFVPGIEGAGVVERVGEGVTSLEPGERVAYAYIQGTYAQKVVLPAERAVKLPDPRRRGACWSASGRPRARPSRWTWT